MKKNIYSYHFFLIAGIGVGNSALCGILRDLAGSSHRNKAIHLDSRWFSRDVRFADAE